MFLNPSLRTRTSFELGMQQLGGIAIVLQPGKDAWGVEFKSGTVMDGDAEEHIAEVAGVLSPLLRPDCFARISGCSKTGLLIAKMRLSGPWRSTPRSRWLTWETIVHPCQELALMLTLKEKLGEVRKKKFVTHLDLAPPAA